MVPLKFRMKSNNQIRGEYLIGMTVVGIVVYALVRIDTTFSLNIPDWVYFTVVGTGFFSMLYYFNK